MSPAHGDLTLCSPSHSHISYQSSKILLEITFWRIVSCWAINLAYIKCLVLCTVYSSECIGDLALQDAASFLSSLTCINNLCSVMPFKPLWLLQKAHKTQWRPSGGRQPEACICHTNRGAKQDQLSKSLFPWKGWGRYPCWEIWNRFLEGYLCWYLKGFNTSCWNTIDLCIRCSSVASANSAGNSANRATPFRDTLLQSAPQRSGVLPLKEL